MRKTELEENGTAVQNALVKVLNAMFSKNGINDD